MADDENIKKEEQERKLLEVALLFPPLHKSIEIATGITLSAILLTTILTIIIIMIVEASHLRSHIIVGDMGTITAIVV